MPFVLVCHWNGSMHSPLSTESSNSAPHTIHLWCYIMYAASSTSTSRLCLLLTGMCAVCVHAHAPCYLVCSLGPADESSHYKMEDCPSWMVPGCACYVFLCGTLWHNLQRRDQGTKMLIPTVRGSTFQQPKSIWGVSLWGVWMYNLTYINCIPKSCDSYVTAWARPCLLHNEC